MTSKIYLMITVIVFGLTANAVYAREGIQHIPNGANRCSVSQGKGNYYVPIRGTGYYWLEYVPRGLNTDNQLLLLIQSTIPIFADSETYKNDEATGTCESQKIVAHRWIELSRAKYIESFDCHIADNMPLPVGELVVGMVSGNSKPGLYESNQSWRIVIHPYGGGGEINETHDSLRVFCTILPTIDE